MRVATRNQIRSIEQHTFHEYGMPSIVLMERAGQAVADAVLDIVSAGEQKGLRANCVVLCGLGGNGGDGFVAARDLLFNDLPVTVWVLPGDQKPGSDAALEYAYLQRIAPEGTITPLDGNEALERLNDAINEDTIIVDALFGIGLDRAITGAAEETIRIVNEREAYAVVAADIPSGIDADTGAALGVPIYATDTVTFGLPKLGLYMGVGAEAAGKIHAEPLIYPDILLDQSEIRVQLAEAPQFPLRPRTMHKGSYGKAAIIAGSPAYTGAPVFAAEAALATGSGTVHLLVPRSIADVVRVKVSGPIVYGVAGDACLTIDAVPELLEQTADMTAALIGPGLGRDPQTLEAILQFAAAFHRPLILDGDALFACVRHLDILWKREAPTVLTPHAGEFARLTGLAPEDVARGNTLEPARRLAAETNAVVLLKGYRSMTVVPDGSALLNTTGNPGMAKPGMGDALGGIILSLVARGVLPEFAAAHGAYLHGLAGDAAAAVMGEESMGTRELITALAATIKQLNAG